MTLLLGALLLTSPIQHTPVILAVDTYVVGYRSGSKWVAAGHAYGTSYRPMRFYSFGPGKMGSPLEGVSLRDGGDIGGAMLSTDKATGLVHLSGVAPKLPRKVATLPVSSTAYLGKLRAFLKKQGLKSAKPRITLLLTVDLDGDGRQEALIEARNREGLDSASSNFTTADYAAVLLVSGNSVLPLEFESYAKTESMELKRLRGIADLDGDGRMEIVTDGQGYEWTNAKLYGYRAGKLIKLLENGAGA